MLARRMRGMDHPVLLTAEMAAIALRQRRVPYVSDATLRRLQRRRIGETVAYAHAHVPYYRETMRRLIMGVEEFREARDLARLPLLERALLQRDPEYFCSERCPPSSCVLLESGGTTGAPLMVFRDPRSLVAGVGYYERQRAVVRQLAGRSMRYREAAIALADSSTSAAYEAIRSRITLPRFMRVDRRRLSMHRAPADLLEELEAFNPHVISSYGSCLEALFTHIRAERPAIAWPRVAVYGGDSMSDAVRGWVSDELGVEVLSIYGAIEASPLGFECEHHHGLHLNIDLYPIRLVDQDGRDATDGDPGEVVISNLVNRGTVLLNYRLGDALTPIAEPCECGRTLPLCSQLERTKEAWLWFGSGRVHAQVLRGILRHEHELWRYQLVQEARSRLLARLVPSPRCDRPTTAERVSRLLEEELDGVSVRVEFVHELPRTAHGKVEPVIALPSLERT
jgi:phenylacetate-CoA ligase